MAHVAYEKDKPEREVMTMTKAWTITILAMMLSLLSYHVVHREIVDLMTAAQYKKAVIQQYLKMNQVPEPYNLPC